jgi:hypothetical protein
VHSDEAELGRPALDLGRPVLQHGERRDDQVGPGEAGGVERRYERQSLQRLPQPHLIRQDAPRAAVVLRNDPVDTLDLVRPELRLDEGLARPDRWRSADATLRRRRHATAPQLLEPRCGDEGLEAAELALEKGVRRGFYLLVRRHDAGLALLGLACELGIGHSRRLARLAVRAHPVAPGALQTSAALGVVLAWAAGASLQVAVNLAAASARVAPFSSHVRGF